MALRGKYLVRLGIALLLVGSVSTNCTWFRGMRKTPRQHWWEFWKPKVPTTDVYYPESPEALPPPPSAVVGEAVPGAESVLPFEAPTAAEALPPAEAPMDLPEVAPIRRAPAGMINELQTVYFEFDSARLTDAARRNLDNNAEFLLQHPEVRVQIAGHCDERGTREYNLSLGQRRADSARAYLASRGVPPANLTVTSYGEERPAVLGSGEEIWRQNRRAEFLIY